MKEIGLDSFTLFEYMLNNRDKNNMYTQPLLGTCQILGLRHHDHARAQYTRELKGAELAIHQHRKGWHLYPEHASEVSVLTMDTTVADLLNLSQPDDTELMVDSGEPVEVSEPPTRDYTGAQLAEAIARQLLDRLEEQSRQLSEQVPSDDVKAKIATLEEQLTVARQAVDDARKTADSKDELLGVAHRKVEALQGEVSRMVREIADKSGDDLKRSAERFLS